MKLVDRVRESFPGLETWEAMEDHRETVREFMNRKSAICAMEAGRVVGARFGDVAGLEIYGAEILK